MPVDGKLIRVINVWGLSSNLVNIMVGAGIFVLPALVAAQLGSASVLAYLFCGAMVILVMLCFAEVGSQIIAPGGTYAYIEKTFGPYFGFLAVIISILGGISADAAVANAVADVLGTFMPVFQQETARIFFFIMLFSGLGYLNVRGVKRSINFIYLITLAKLIPLILIVFLSWTQVNYSFLEWHSIPSFEHIGQASLVLFFAFQGTESGLSVSGEVKDPRKTVPMAIFMAVGAVLVLYLLVQTVCQGILGSELPLFQENPISEVASKVFGPIGFTLITIGAGVSMFGNLSSQILSTPRLLYGAAKDRVIPISVLNKVHRRFATPYIAIVSYVVIVILSASMGGFKQLAVIASASCLLIYLGVVLAVIKLRRDNRGNTKQNHFRIPFGYTVPILAIGVVAWFLSHLTAGELGILSVVMIFLSIGYFLIRKFGAPDA